jgi:hypothetical protein
MAIIIKNVFHYFKSNIAQFLYNLCPIKGYSQDTKDEQICLLILEWILQIYLDSVNILLEFQS